MEEFETLALETKNQQRWEKLCFQLLPHDAKEAYETGVSMSILLPLYAAAIPQDRYWQIMGATMKAYRLLPGAMHYLPKEIDRINGVSLSVPQVISLHGWASPTAGYHDHVMHDIRWFQSTVFHDEEQKTGSFLVNILENWYQRLQGDTHQERPLRGLNLAASFDLWQRLERSVTQNNAGLVDGSLYKTTRKPIALHG